MMNGMDTKNIGVREAYAKTAKMQYRKISHGFRPASWSARTRRRRARQSILTEYAAHREGGDGSSAVGAGGNAEAREGGAACARRKRERPTFAGLLRL